MVRNLLHCSLLSLLLLGSANLLAADAAVTAVGVKYEPMFVYVEPGDSVSWENMVGHNVETIDQMVPDGTEKINTELGDNVTLKFDNPGIFVYKCTPHWGARMGGVVVVGQPENPTGIIDAYFAAIEENKAELLPAKGILKKLRADMETKSLL